jgi:long-chain fatty acid transport protein
MRQARRHGRAAAATTTCVTLIGLSGTAGTALAAGYAIREQSAVALGNAFAGATSAAEDVSHMFFNPAALGRLDGYAADLSLSYVRPEAEVDDAVGRTAAGTPIGGTTSNDDAAENGLIPALYGMVPLGDRVRAGLGITAPFGLTTSYPDGWVGRYHAVDSELRTININPALAVRATDWLSLGAGFQAQYADGELTNAVDFGTIGAGFGVPGAIPGGRDGFARLDGDDWGYGYTLGALLEPVRGTRLGVAYRSEVEHTLRGDVDFSADAAGVAGALRGATGAFRDSGASLEVTTPATLSFGVHQELGRRFAVMAEAQWTEWSEFEELRVEFDNPAQPDSVTEQAWDDSWFFALGATWRPLDALTLRAGVAYDQTPVRNRFRTPRIPDGDRHWLAFGLSWEPRPGIALDLGYTHVWVDDTRVDLAASDEGSAFRGDLRADYENQIDIVAAGLRLRF